MTAAIRERPAHVDPARVIDFDFYSDPRYFETGDMHEAIARMSEEQGRGIFWTPRNGGHWFINDHELLFEAARNTGLFSSNALTLPALPPGQEPHVLPVSLDGAEHLAYRLPLMQAFAPGKVREFQPFIHDFARELIDAVAANGRCDFVDAIAEPLPVIIFMKFMGLDTTRLKEFRHWVYDMLSSDDDRRLRSHKLITAMLAEELAARRDQPRDDLMSRLMAGRVRDRPLNEEELLAFCLLLFAAGLDTVANSISFGMQFFARNPAVQDRLRAEPALIPEAVEELLRMFAVANIVRVITRDDQFGGAELKAGERLLLLLPAGNYDPKVFPEPDRFDLDRENKAHISFNAGPHRCVGSHLARLELITFYQEWFSQMPNVALDPAAQATMRGGQTLALGSLPIIW